MEVENGVVLFNQPPNSKRQKREKDIDHDEESRVLMRKLKVAREEVLEYLNDWKVLSFEDQVKEGVKFVMTIDPSKYVDEIGTRLELMEGVEREDILNEIKLYEEMIHFCQAQYSAFWDRFSEKYDPQWLGCMRKLNKMENIQEELIKDRADRKVCSYYIIGTLERLSDWDGKEETDTGETTYEALRNVLDKQTELSDCYEPLIDPVKNVMVKGSGILMFLERAVNLKELVEEGAFNPKEWM